MQPAKKKLGLSLSGGGYRAAAFHLGTLKKLQEMNLLGKVEVISTISGGSIIGAYYLLHKGDFPAFEATAYKKLQEDNVIKRVVFSSTSLGLLLMVVFLLGPAFYLLFTPWAWLFPVLLALFIFGLLKYQFYIFPVSRGVEKAYDAFFYQNKKLGDLPDAPELVIGATNIPTSRPFTFSKTYMGDSTYEFRKPPVVYDPVAFPISRAVMASSCVPFAFTPISIDPQFLAEPKPEKPPHPMLVDGGVYDNQGIHKLTVKGRYECSHVITSDAGGGGGGETSFRNTIALLIATVDVFMNRIKKAEMVEDIYRNTEAANKEIAYLSLAWDIERCIPGFYNNLLDGNITRAVIDAHQFQPEWLTDPRQFREPIISWLEQRTGYAQIKAAAPTSEQRTLAQKVGTNLTSLSKDQVDCLMQQAACLTELQVKLYCPSI